MVWFYLNRHLTFFPHNGHAFNPTMVWFYPQLTRQWMGRITLLSIPLWSDFIIVRSGATIDFYYDFQSHYGLILSSTVKSCLEQSKESFNPTMVWFYHFNKSNDFYEAFGFQSHYGLILSHAWCDVARSLWYLSIPLWSDFIDYIFSQKILQMSTFNPTMVWFYPMGRFFISIAKYYFQSHYGLILSISHFRHFHDD